MTRDKARLPTPRMDSFDSGEFSTKPIKIRLESSNRSFLVPRNYFSPNAAGDPDEEELPHFGFILFLPDFQGFTRDTAKFYAPEHFPPVKGEKYFDSVYVLGVTPLEKVDRRNGKNTPVPPNVWGDPMAMLQAVTKGYELIREEYGLKCYGKKGSEGKGNRFPCIGARSNGELIFMWAADPPELEGVPYLCDVLYASDQEQLFVNYRYSRRHLSQWREIDDAIWAKLKAWGLRSRR